MGVCLGVWGVADKQHSLILLWFFFITYLHSCVSASHSRGLSAPQLTD